MLFDDVLDFQARRFNVFKWIYWWKLSRRHGVLLQDELAFDRLSSRRDAIRVFPTPNMDTRWTAVVKDGGWQLDGWTGGQVDRVKDKQEV